MGRSVHLSSPTPGCDMKICGSFWKSAATTMVGMFCSTVMKSPIMSPPMIEFDLAGEQQHAAVRLRPARQDRDVEPVFFVSAVDERLIIAAGLGIGEPIGAERDLVERESRTRENDEAGKTGPGGDTHHKLPCSRVREVSTATSSRKKSSPGPTWRDRSIGEHPGQFESEFLERTPPPEIFPIRPPTATGAPRRRGSVARRALARLTPRQPRPDTRISTDADSRAGSAKRQSRRASSAPRIWSRVHTHISL